MRSLPLLPIGIQDFTKIRESGYCYVDKTARIHQLITSSTSACFLSRPRRFGKSLLCSTLGAIFEGRRELFREIAGQPALAIDSLVWDWKKHPVIHLDLNAGVYSNGVDALRETLYNTLKKQAAKLKIKLTKGSPLSQFMDLISDAYYKYGERVVVIIDEYDKPLIETITLPEIHNQLRNELKGFYGVLKFSDDFLRFVFLTGVTKFSQVSIFSDLNQLYDLSLDVNFADICGLTEEEILNTFEPYIEKNLLKNKIQMNTYLNNLRTYYNGYRFSKNEITVYNPFGLLKHFQTGEFLPYWFETGTPTFLVNLITKQKIDITKLNNFKKGYEEFHKFDIDNMDAVIVLYQTGYLTIIEVDTENFIFSFDYPNEEVRSSFMKSLIKLYLKTPENDADALFIKLPKALKNGNITETMETLKQFMAAIPYKIIAKIKKENYYQTVVHIIFNMFGLSCRSEVCTSDGRLDALVETDKFVYCFEFKVDKNADIALTQIEEKEYLLPWQGKGKQLFKVGVNFDSKKRNIGDWKYLSNT
jgi:hypothetical protein